MSLEKSIVTDQKGRDLYFPLGRLTRARVVATAEDRDRLETTVAKIKKVRAMIVFIPVLLGLLIVVFKNNSVAFKFFVNALFVYLSLYPLLLSYLMSTAAKDLSTLSWHETYSQKPSRFSFVEMMFALGISILLFHFAFALMRAKVDGIAILFLAFSFYILFPVMMSLYAKIYNGKKS